MGYYFNFLGTAKDLFVGNIRLLVGIWKLTRHKPPFITIFGGAKIPPDHHYAIVARDVAKVLASKGISIITGGGPGIMQAANQGVLEYLKECKLVDDGQKCASVVSAGVGLVRLNVEKKNPFVHENIVMKYFFERKWLLVRYSVGFLVFPGGFGTLDELFEILTLEKTDHMKKVSIVLFGKEYWQPMIDWCVTKALNNGFMSQAELDLITVTDNISRVVEILSAQCLKR